VILNYCFVSALGSSFFKLLIYNIYVFQCRIDPFHTEMDVFTRVFTRCFYNINVSKLITVTTLFAEVYLGFSCFLVFKI